MCKTRCYDKDPACGDWARQGECARNDGLLTICPVSCGLCTELCLDKHNDCPQWASRGNCGTNPSYMLRSCPNSCGICTDVTHEQSPHPVGGRELHLTETRACADTGQVHGEHEIAVARGRGALGQAKRDVLGLTDVELEPGIFTGALGSGLDAARRHGPDRLVRRRL